MYHFTVDLEIYDPIKNDKNYFDKYLKDTNKIIDYVFDKLNENKIKITCFVTNEFVENFYEKFKKKICPYHEISCHTANHNFYNGANEKQFFASIKKNKSYLEEVTGRICYGFRSPGGVAPKNLVLYLSKLDFKYDSSVIPGVIPGRHYNFFSPKYPYHPDKYNIYKKGFNQKSLLEFPLSVLPFFRISVNGFFYPCLFVPFKKYYWKKETTTFVHLQDFYDTAGKKFIWDYLNFKKIGLGYFYELANVYKNSDLSLIKYLNDLQDNRY